MQLNPYLEFGGNCEEAFTFYADCFGGAIESMITHGSMPMEGQPADPAWADKIMHASLTVDGQGLMGTDVPPHYRREPQGFSVSINTEDPAEADRIFGELSENGNVSMPIQETFWAVRFGMVTDRFGIHWMVNCHKPQVENEAAEAGEGEAAETSEVESAAE